MSKEFKFEIISNDGKRFTSNVVEALIKAPKGILGILKGHAPLVSFLDITSFQIIYSDGSKEFFATSGALLNVSPEKLTIICDNFETRDEIDKDRVIKSRDYAYELLKHLSAENSEEVAKAQRHLNKALNRLSLLD